jgi:hypothetical protein
MRVSAIIIDDTSEKTIETMRVPYLNIHSLSLPSDLIDPSIKSFPINKQKMIFTEKNKKSPNNSIVFVFINANDTMKTNIKNIYLVIEFVSDVAIE